MKKNILIILSCIVVNVFSFSNEKLTKEEKIYLKEYEKGDLASLKKLISSYKERKNFEFAEKYLLNLEKENKNEVEMEKIKREILALYNYWNNTSKKSVLKRDVEKSKELKNKIIPRYYEILKYGNIRDLVLFAEFCKYNNEPELEKKLIKEAADKGNKEAINTLEREKKDREDIEKFKKIVGQGGDKINLLYIALDYRRLGEYNLAEQYFLKTLEYKQDHYIYRYIASFYYNNLKNYDKAIKYYKIAIEKISSKEDKFYSEEFWEKIGDAYFLQGNYEKAEEAYKTSLKFKHPANNRDNEKKMLKEILKIKNNGMKE